MAKGAGMIHPRMATMLAYVFTDIVASPKELQRALRQAADESFNAISIDGDTSTTDTVLLMASGSSGVPLKKAGRQFQEALLEVCLSLSRQIVADGEGVQHVITLRIEQARSKEEARAVARSIANSPLVKTAWAGADPNWGRMLAAAGYSGVALDPERINIFIGEQQVCRKGVAHPFDGKAAHEHMSRPEYEIGVQLGRGKDSLCFFTCDLTSEYVKINADYST
jgi:glutamate N-acetyltransferase/amino-acid N-acetyltransferase